jgi:hypothetical protein
MQATAPAPVHHRSRRRRRTLAKGVLKALFTTSPTEATKVVAYDDGAIEIEPVSKDETQPDAESSSLSS